jgi:hypothetical protein
MRSKIAPLGLVDRSLDHSRRQRSFHNRDSSSGSVIFQKQRRHSSPTPTQPGNQVFFRSNLTLI